MNYRLVQQLQQKAIPVQQSCQGLEITIMRLDKALRPSAQRQSICRGAFEASSGRSYGSRRLRDVLNHQGVRIGRYHVRSLMRTHQLKPVWRRKFVHTTDSRHDLPVLDNVLNRQFEQSAIN
jgi:putative transposase